MATLAQLENALVNSDKAGDMDAARKLAAVIARARKDASNQIPDTPVQETVQTAPEPSIGDQLVGAGETALTLATGATGGTVGMIGGALKGLAEQILSGQFGTPQATKLVEQSAAQGGQALTYAPRTQAGQDQVQAVGRFAQNIPPVMPVIGPIGAVSSSISAGARAAAPAVAATARKVFQPVAQAASKGAEKTAAAVRSIGGPEIIRGVDDVRPVGASGGAMATPLERQRSTEASIAGLKLTEGETKRSPQMLAWEKEKAKSPEYQQQFLERQQENNRAALNNLEQTLDDTGAQTGTLGDTGIKVVDTLMQGYNAEKKKTGALYDAFRASPESQSAIDATPVASFLDSQARGVSGVTGITDTARQNAVKLNIATEVDGQLMPNPNATLGMLEDFRQSINALGITSPNDKRLASTLKRTIDEIGDPVGGNLTKAMRAQRRNQAAKFENRAIVARLLLDKKGMADAQVPIEDVFSKTILNSRPSEIQHIKRVINTLGDKEGKQAWAELQGATIRHIMDKSENGIGTDNLPVISAAKMNKVVAELDKNGKLDMVLGAKNAEQVRNLNKVLQYIQSVPPGTSINNSGTARTVMGLLAESAGMGAVTGVPLPIVQGMKMLRDNVRDKRIKARITKALNYTPQETQ